MRREVSRLVPPVPSMVSPLSLSAGLGYSTPLRTTIEIIDVDNNRGFSFFFSNHSETDFFFIHKSIYRKGFDSTL